MCIVCYRQKHRLSKLEFRKTFGKFKKQSRIGQANRENKHQLVQSMQKLRSSYVNLTNQESR